MSQRSKTLLDTKHRAAFVQVARWQQGLVAMLALLELGLVLGLGFALGLYELRSLRRDRRAREAARTRSGPSSPAP